MSKVENDSVIKGLIFEVKKQEIALGKKPKLSWITNGIFKKDSANYFNINTVTDANVLAGALGFLIQQEEAFLKGCSALGVSGDFSWDGYSVKEWEEDFKTRIRIIEFSKKEKSLDAIRKKLNSLISEDARTEMELADIRKTLGL